MPVIPAVRRWKKENQEFKGILSCIVSSKPAFGPETLSQNQANKQPKIHQNPNLMLWE